MRSTPVAIFTAAAHAQRAADRPHAQQPDPASATFLDPPQAKTTVRRPGGRLRLAWERPPVCRSG